MWQSVSVWEVLPVNKIEIRDVSVTYGAGTPFEVQALKHINASFGAGRITGIIGHTGSGKSTLVQLFNGLYQPTSGEILLDGTDIWSKPKQMRDIRFRVGLVLQYPEYQLFDETVRSDIGFALRNRGVAPEEIDRRVETVCERVGLDPALLSASPFDLSGGEKRRAAIAGVLVMEPEVLVMDEPAAGLDPRGRREILGTLKQYRDRTGATVILVSHSMEDMASYCEDVLVLNEGEVFAAGTTQEIFSRADDLVRIGLDVPQISLIASDLVRRGIHLTGELYTVEGVRRAILSCLERGAES